MKNKHKIIYIFSFLLVIFTYLIPIPFIFIYYPILIYVIIKVIKQIKKEKELKSTHLANRKLQLWIDIYLIIDDNNLTDIRKYELLYLLYNANKDIFDD